MTLTAQDLVAAIARAFQSASDNSDHLNRLDAALGDGDLGETVDRCAAELGPLVGKPYATVAQALNDCASELSNVSGSSFATVSAVGLMGAASHKGEEASLELGDLAMTLDAAMAAIFSLGQVSLGDKTVMDGLDAIQKALTVPAPPAEMLSRAETALEAAIATFNNQIFKTGRGRVYGERARGLDDPGMVALRYALQGLRA